MLIATAPVLHRVYTFDKTLSVTVWSGVALTAVLTTFSIWHCVTDEIVMHSLVFGIMIVLVGIQTRSIIGARIPDPAVRKEVIKLTTWGGVIFVSGYAIWNLDNAFCGLLTETRRYIGMPWAFVLELHGWWHILTGIGAYICMYSSLVHIGNMALCGPSNSLTVIALVEYLTSDEAGQPLSGRFAWPACLIVNGSAGAKEPGNQYSSGSRLEKGKMNGKRCS